MALTPKQARFVEEYLVDLNGTQAAIRAGYAESGASVEACRLLGNANIADAVAAAQAERGERVNVDQDWVMRRFLAISNRCMQIAPVYDRKGKPVMVQGDDGEKAQAFIFDAAGANKATEMIAKHLGMFVERSQTLDKNGNPTDPVVPSLVVTIAQAKAED